MTWLRKLSPRELLAQDKETGKKKKPRAEILNQYQSDLNISSSSLIFHKIKD